jgi:acyl-CoA thioesterase
VTGRLNLIHRLRLDEVGVDAYETHETPAPGHVFGGMLVAQSLRAA